MTGPFIAVFVLNLLLLGVLCWHIWVIRSMTMQAHEIGRSEGYDQGYQQAIEHITKGVGLAQLDEGEDGPGPVHLPGSELPLPPL